MASWNFPVQMWNVYENEDYRTNNHLEGWQKRLKCLVGKTHPNIYEFVEVIKEQTATEFLLLQLSAGASVPKNHLNLSPPIKRSRSHENKYTTKRFATATQSAYAVVCAAQIHHTLKPFAFVLWP